MIVGLRGILEATSDGWARVRIGGVSIQVLMPVTSVADLGSVGEEVYLHTYLQVKDEQAVLYGFPNPESSRLFQMLLGVSGIGPKTALGLLSSREPQSLAAAIATGDVDALSAVSGVGRKSAGRIVVELKSKLALEVAEMPVTPGKGDNELVAALMALGYSMAEVRHSVTSLGDVKELSLEEKLRRALQQMAGG